MNYCKFPTLVLTALLAHAPMAADVPGGSPDLSFSYSLDATGNVVPTAPTSAISFPPTLVDGSSSATFIISNRGTASALIRAVTVTGDGFQLSGAPAPGTNVLAAGEVRFSIRFAPTLVGAAQGGLHIDSSLGILNFTLAGNGLGPVFSYTVVKATGAAPLLPSQTISFPDTAAANKANLSVQVGNTGSAPGKITDVAILGSAFQLADLPFFPVTLRPGDFVAFTVTFSPAEAGAATGRLRVGNDTFNLSGVGVGVALSLVYDVVRGSDASSVLPLQTIPFPDTPLTNKATLSVRVRNAGTASAKITDAAILGASFSLADAPFFPLTLRPGDSATMTIAFAPSQAGPATGRLRIGDDTFNLTGAGIGAALIFSYTAGGTLSAVQAGGTVILSPTAIGTTGSTRFSIANNGTAAATFASIGVEGVGKIFSLPDLQALPLTIAPGESAAFTVVFAPTALGSNTATLRIDQNVFPCIGSGTDPAPLPRVNLEGPSGIQDPLAQLAVGLTLAAPYSIGVNGTLTLSFDSDVFSNDPSIQFATGGRTVSFTIPANSTRAVFPNNATQVRIQTGSVAGTITISPSFSTDSGVSLASSSPAVMKLSIPASAPRLLTAQVSSRSATGLTLDVTGLATGRNVRQIDLRFTPITGVSMPTAGVTLSVEPVFSLWFQNAASQQYGGLFSVSVPISVQGTVSTGSLIDALQSVSITASNQQGVSNSQTVQLR